MLSLAQFNKNLDINEEKGGFICFFFSSMTWRHLVVPAETTRTKNGGIKMNGAHLTFLHFNGPQAEK